MADEPNDKPKVVNLAEKRKKQEPEEDKDKDDGPKAAELYHAISRAINRERQSTLPAFQRRFHVVQNAPGVYSIIEEREHGVVHTVPLTELRTALVQYTAGELAGRRAFAWTVSQAQAAAEFWCAVTPAVPEPPAVRWLDEDGLTFSRLPWTYDPSVADEALPLFGELMGRMTNATALMEWVGSLFDPYADRQQYVWIYGQGQNGKGALMRFLAKVLGNSYRSMQPPNGSDSHWTSGLLGARLVAFPDCNAYGFPATGLFKSLTGGDGVMINPKNRDIYTAELSAKFLFSSNERPQLSSEKADLRRAIYCEAKPIAGEADATYEARLWAEGGAFLSKCIHSYRTSYPQGGPIRVDTEELTDLVSVVEEDFETLVSSHMVIGPDERCLQTQWVGFCKKFLKDTKSKRDFMSYLERRHGLRFGERHRKTIRTNTGTAKVCTGFRLLSNYELNQAHNDGEL